MVHLVQRSADGQEVCWERWVRARAVRSVDLRQRERFDVPGGRRVWWEVSVTHGSGAKQQVDVVACVDLEGARVVVEGIIEAWG